MVEIFLMCVLLLVIVFIIISLEDKYNDLEFSCNVLKKDIAYLSKIVHKYENKYDKLEKDSNNIHDYISSIYEELEGGKNGKK